MPILRTIRRAARPNTWRSFAPTSKTLSCARRWSRPAFPWAYGERRPQPFVNYHGFADPSGGSADSFALCIGHKDHGKQIVVVDALREIKAPFSPENAVYEFARLLKSYNISKIEGDHYAGLWPVEQFGRFGIRYEPSARPKSQLYVDLLPLINARRIELLDDPRLINQLCALERRTAAGTHRSSARRA